MLDVWKPALGSRFSEGDSEAPGLEFDACHAQAGLDFQNELADAADQQSRSSFIVRS